MSDNGHTLESLDEVARALETAAYSADFIAERVDIPDSAHAHNLSLALWLIVRDVRALERQQKEGRS